MALIGYFVGALVIAFLVSRLALLLLSRWKAGMPKIVIANVASWLVTGLVSSVGLAHGGPPQFGIVFGMYVVPQLVCLAFDVLRFRKIGAVTITPWKSK